MRIILHKALSSLLAVSLAGSSLGPSIAFAQAAPRVSTSIINAAQIVQSVGRLTTQPVPLQSPVNDNTPPPPPEGADGRQTLAEIEARLAAESKSMARRPSGPKPYPGSDMAAVMVVSFMVAGTQMVREAYDEKRMYNQSLSISGSVAIYGETSDTILKSEDFWLGAVGAAATQPLAMMLHALGPPTPNRTRWRNKSSAPEWVNFVTLVGWQLVSQLWREAVMLQPAEMQKNARGVAYRVFKLMTRDDMTPVEQLKNDPDYKLLQAIVSSMMDILFHNSGIARRLDPQNAFRRQMETGRRSLPSLWFLPPRFSR